MHASKAVALSAKRLQERKLIILPLRQLHNTAKNYSRIPVNLWNRQIYVKHLFGSILQTDGRNNVSRNAMHQGVVSLSNISICFCSHCVYKLKVIYKSRTLQVNCKCRSLYLIQRAEKPSSLH